MANDLAVDDITVLRSCISESFVHAPAMYQLTTGRLLAGHPSLGSWVSYGLGTENQNLPSYVVMLDDDKQQVRSGSRNWREPTFQCW